MKKKNKKILRSAIAILIAVATTVAYFPLLGDGAYAAEQNGKSGEAYYALPGEDGEGTGFVSVDDALTSDEVKAEINAQVGAPKAATNNAVKPLEEGTLNALDGGDLVQAASADEGLSECGLAVSGTAPSPGEIQAMGDAIEGEDENEPSPITGEEQPYSMDIVINSAGIATLDAHIDIEGVYFTDLYVDDDWVDDFYREDIEGKTIDMKNFPVGYHTVKLLLNVTDDDGYNYYIYRSFIPTEIYSKPSLRQADFYTGYNYFNYYDNYNYYSYDETCGLYLDYKKAGGGWSVGYGPVGYGKSKQRGGLAAASTYSVRTYYAKSTEYTPPRPIDATEDPATEYKVFMGPYANAVSFKTGYKATPVKSVKAKKVKQWCKKVKILKLSSKVYYRNGYAGWGYYRKVLGKKTKKYWYTKVKVTVTMSKVPGVAGVYIGSKLVKGNKKTYATNFTLSGKKKGKKISVSVYSYMSPVYGGLSGKVLKKVKVK